MHITFGLHLDTGVWPHPLHDRQAIAGHPTVGPLGFLDLLETHLGLTAPRPPASLRVAAFYQALQQQDAPTRFYHRSFATDPWGVAAHLLTWHDQLTEAGWTGQPLGTGRLHDLTSLPAQPGFAARIWATVDPPKPFIDTVHLADPLEDYPRPWQALLAPLHTEPLPPIPPQEPAILHLQGACPTETAEILASWFKHHAPPATVLITESATDTLDEALHYQDLPTLGSERRSRWRPATQVLPLLLALAWHPLDPYRLLEFLSLPRSPLSPSRHDLARALMKSPGIDNPLWREAYTQSPDQPWLSHLALHDRADGMPVDTVRTLTAQVIAWATDDTARAHAVALQDALAFWTAPTLPAAHLEQLIAQITDQDTTRRTWPAQAGPFYRVRNPGAILAPADTIVWWPFVDDLPALPALPWTAAERALLAEAGVVLPTLSNLLRAREWAWRRPLQAAQHLILASWTRNGADPVRPHPLWDELGTPPTRPDLPTRPLALRGGREPRPIWQVASGLLRPRPQESATSIEMLLHCPLRWTLHYHARLLPRPLMGLPDQELLFGLLAHRIIGDVLLQSPAPATARTLAEQAFTRYLPEMAAALLQRSRTIERTRLGRTIATATEQIVQHLHASPYAVTGVEVTRQGTFGTSTLEGAVDVLLSNRDTGQPALLDLKWTGRRYRKKLLSGTAIQLAVYGHLVGATAVGYYAVHDHQLLIPSGTAFTDRSPLHGPPLSDTLSATTENHAERLGQLSAGTIHATGHDDISDDRLKDGVLTLKPPCTFCDYAAFCGAGRD